MRCSSFCLALGAALILPMASMAVADECPLAAAKKAQAKAHVQPVSLKAE